MRAAATPSRIFSSELLFLAGALIGIVAAVQTEPPHPLQNFAASDSCVPQFMQNAISTSRADLCCQSASAHIHLPVIRRHNKKTSGLRSFLNVHQFFGKRPKLYFDNAVKIPVHPNRLRAGVAVDDLGGFPLGGVTSVHRLLSELLAPCARRRRTTADGGTRI